LSVDDAEIIRAGSLGKWAIGIDSNRGFHHFGLDSEGTGREQVNLLSSPIRLTWTGSDWSAARWFVDCEGRWVCSMPESTYNGRVDWIVEEDGDDLLWTLEYQGSGEVDGIVIEMEFDPLMSACVIVPSVLDEENRGIGPWMLVSTDFGHLMIDAESDHVWTAQNGGCRGGGSRSLAPLCGVDPALRGEAWIEAVKIPDYVSGKLLLQLSCNARLSQGTVLKLCLRSRTLNDAQEIDPELWRQIRRAYLNSWQPNGTWCGKEKAWVLSNNVLSDPASCSLRFYAEPMLFYHEPFPGIDLLYLLRQSLDYWLDHHVGAVGHVNAFGLMYDLYPVTGCSLIDSAWIYWTLSGDRQWLLRRIPRLHLMADYLLRRDIDKDGLLEDYSSGIAGTLRDPDRANIWFEMMNFGFKNSYFNLHAYRSLMLIADMLEGIGLLEPGEENNPLISSLGRAGIPDETAFLRGATYYRTQAARIREAFNSQLLGTNGWFVSWKDLNGEVHDYCHTFINGMAVAYGIVPPDEGRQILQLVVEKSKSIGFDSWHLGVPANLLPVRKQDMIQARIGIDGEPIRDHFYWPDDLTEEDAFGYRYPNGTIHPMLVWPYLLGLQVAGLEEEADRILDAMIESAKKGLFMNGIVNVGLGGAEHFYINGKTCGYEGYLPESYNFLMAAFTRNPLNRDKLLAPLRTV
jgi:hypothetical protein